MHENKAGPFPLIQNKSILWTARFGMAMEKDFSWEDDLMTKSYQRQESHLSRYKIYNVLPSLNNKLCQDFLKSTAKTMGNPWRAPRPSAEVLSISRMWWVRWPACAIKSVSTVQSESVLDEKFAHLPEALAVVNLYNRTRNSHQR